MPAIHENLKMLRNSSGLSQSEVADAINVTRQTVSSYETGRTQPDLETLKRLAELYNANLHDVLYGGNRRLKKIKLVRRLVCIISILLLLSLLIHSVLRLANNTFFAIESGTAITDENRQLVIARFAIRDAAETVARVGNGVFAIGCLFLLHLVITIEKPLSIKMRIAWLLSLTLAAFAVVLPFMLTDKVYGYGDYLYPLWVSLSRAVLLFLASVAVDIVRRIRGRRQA